MERQKEPAAAQPTVGRGVLEGAFLVLEELARLGEAGPAQVGAGAGLHKATAHRLLDQLVGLGAVQRRAGRYRMGLAGPSCRSRGPGADGARFGSGQWKPATSEAMRKRAEGKRHKQAMLAPARRRVNVLWAMVRDGQVYEPLPGVGRDRFTVALFFGLLKRDTSQRHHQGRFSNSADTRLCAPRSR